MRSKMLAAAVFVSVLGPAAARAQQGYWGVSGAACTPGDPAIQADRYTIGAGSVKHKAGASGLITLYCAVNPGIQGLTIVNHPAYGFINYPCAYNAFLLRQTYMDSDGPGTEVYVRSTLQRMSKANGAIWPVPYAVVHSNSYPDTVSTNQTPWFDHAFDFTNYNYYVRVDLDRVVGSTESAIFYGVAIECR